ncbi:MAG: phosphoenolpyruvate--protein phosphotransferase [Chthoniobacterales bacterium]|nr:MAG: phosphoenolpyruvate--protein phosphotransferase [Chthoniobacterales bacterium]
MSDAPEQRYHGIGVSPGIVRGVVQVMRDELEEIERCTVAPADVQAEIARFESALVQTRLQILEMQQKIAETIGTKDAGIFDAHLLVVEDRTLIDEVLRKLESEKINVESAFEEVAQRYVASLSRIDDPYLRERAIDIQDVMRRVIRNLQGKTPHTVAFSEEAHILVAHNLTPSDTASIDRQRVLGIATDLGSRTSHTAIMARSLTLPAVVGLHDATAKLESGCIALLDGFSGTLIIDPSPETLAHYDEVELRQLKLSKELTELREKSATTRDGRHIVLSANIELPDDIVSVAANGAEGIGLYRTEFLYLDRDSLPGEEEQFETYRRVAEAVRPHPLIIRTFDLGGDKIAGGIDVSDELNPFLGWRAIRFCLEHLEVFKPQLRAILRASVAGNVKLMFPMISGVVELRRALGVLEECKTELRTQKIEFAAEMEVGAMIEIPSAAICSETLAPLVAFFSVGTNDLIQYAVAVDRSNERIAHLYEPTHPSVVRLINLTGEAARNHKIWFGVCGEMAGDIELTPLLLGLGVDELSVSPALVPRVKSAIRSLAYDECQQLIKEIMALETPAEVLERCLQLARERYPTLLN